MSEKKRKPSRPFPVFDLETALAVPRAIAERNAGKPLDRLLVADAVGRKPSSSDFRALLSASFNYGLTLGTQKANEISLTDLGQRIAMPTNAADKAKALIEAACKPELLGRIYKHFDRSKLPDGEFFKNQLVRIFEVPAEYAEEVAGLVQRNASYAGLFLEASGSKYIRVDGKGQSSDCDDSSNDQNDHSGISAEGDNVDALDVSGDAINSTPAHVKEASPPAKLRVFISHGRDMEIVDQVKTMLDLADFEAEVAVEQESTAIPVPQKVLEAMRRCDAAIICVTSDNGESDEAAMLNENVLIEIGAAFVLYDKQVVLVWEKGLPVPSNLQGLYRCEVDSGQLSWSSGMKLMATIKKFAIQ